MCSAYGDIKNNLYCNFMKNKTLSSTGVDMVNCLNLNVVNIYFVGDSWIVLRMRVTQNIVEIIRISKPPWFNNNIRDFNR